MMKQALRDSCIRAFHFAEMMLSVPWRVAQVLLQLGDRRAQVF